jgi:DNA (cytosine-5)-methyltransferase 1
MSRWALYHDFDELKCEVIREAIKARAITDGEVICGDIKQLAANDVRGFRRCHFFAGGGFWDLALNLAGWGDEPVWTGSCPCPSFSAAGKGGGFDDPRHLWPDWARLIRECRPPVVFGEQADAAVGYGWVDLVQTDMEAATYAFGKVVFGAHSVGAPHIRQRLYFCAESESERRKRQSIHRPSAGVGGALCETRPFLRPVPRSTTFGLSPNPDGRLSGDRDLQRSGEHGLFAQDRGTGDAADAERDGGRSDLTRGIAEGRTVDGRDCTTGDGSDTPQRGLPMRGRSQGDTGHLALADEAECGSNSDVSCATRLGPDSGEGETTEGIRGGPGYSGCLLRPWRGPGWLDPQQARSIAETGATRGFWADCDWWYGRDAKYRPIGPGLQPLAHGSAARVGRLRLYGDAIVVSQAAEFIQAYKESRGIA